MTSILLSGLGIASALCGALLVSAWAYRNLAVFERIRRVDEAQLAVEVRLALQSNQGVAIIRVDGQRMLVSTGEGGVQLLTELRAVGDVSSFAEQTDAPADEWAPSRFERRSRLHRSVSLGLLMLALGGGASGAVAQVPATPDATGLSVGAEGSSNSTAFEADESGLAPLMDVLPGVSLQVGDEDGGLTLNGTVGTVIVLGLMSLLPSLLLLTTSFTRIYIVLHLLRQALGTQNTPPGHLLAAMALLLSAAVMAPTLDEVRGLAVDPWIQGQIEDGEMLQKATIPMRAFMLSQVRPEDIDLFVGISRTPTPQSPQDVSNTVLMSAFVTSELRTAFEIGFAVFLPFIIIDLVVAAVLTSMGMFMLPPTMIALPCKLMLFVLMDGWSLIIGTLAQSFA